MLRLGVNGAGRLSGPQFIDWRCRRRRRKAYWLSALGAKGRIGWNFGMASGAEHRNESGAGRQEPVSSYSSIGDDYRSLACSRLPENAYRADAMLRYSDFALIPALWPPAPSARHALSLLPLRS